MKPFTAIIFTHQPFTTESYRTFLENKFFKNHPVCYHHEIQNNFTIAYYTDPIYVAILLEKSKEYYCRISLLDDKITRKLHARTISIQENSQIIIKHLQQLNGRIIEESSTEVTVRLPSFLKATQLLRKLRAQKIKAKFATKKLCRQLKSNIDFCI